MKKKCIKTIKPKPIFYINSTFDVFIENKYLKLCIENYNNINGTFKNYK